MEALRKLNPDSIFLSKPYDVLMFAICILYALTALPWIELNDYLEEFIIYGSLPVLFIKLSRREGDNQIFWLFVLAICVQFASWLNSLHAIPDFAKSHPKFDPLSALFLFALIALWIDNNKTRLVILYSSFVLSFISTALYDNYVAGSFALGLAGKRVDYGMDNAQFTGMLSAVVLMLTVYFRSYLAKPPKNRPVTGLHLLSAAIIGFALFSLLASQSRQSWIAGIVVLICLPLMLRRSIPIKKALFAYLILAIFFVALANVEFVRKRILNDLRGIKMTDQIAVMVEGNWDDLPMQSAGVRVHSWLEASTWIEENPILGTDYSSVSLVTRTSEKFQASEDWRDLGHLHNFYLETLVAYGFVGLVFLGLFYREIIKNVLSHKTRQEHVLLFSFLLFWAIINCFESFNDKILGLYAQNIVLAGLYTYRKPRIN